MFGALDISVSGMVAQRTRMASIASNIVNMHATANELGEPMPYQRRIVHMAPVGGDDPFGSAIPRGVQVAEISLDESEPKLAWEPNHPHAFPDGHEKAGYVAYPNIDPATEQVNAIMAQRAYEANLAAADATKTMMTQALRLLA